VSNHGGSIVGRVLEERGEELTLCQSWVAMLEQETRQPLNSIIWGH